MGAFFRWISKRAVSVWARYYWARERLDLENIIDLFFFGIEIDRLGSLDFEIDRLGLVIEIDRPGICFS